MSYEICSDYEKHSLRWGEGGQWVNWQRVGYGKAEWLCFVSWGRRDFTGNCHFGFAKSSLIKPKFYINLYSRADASVA